MHILAEENVNYGFFGRNGGVSVGNFESLNCSPFVGDDPSAVSQNLETVRKEIAATKLFTMKQMHGNVAIFLDPDSDSNLECDALVTNEPNIAVGVLTADCAPVLLFDPIQRVVAAAHAGWKGAKAGVLTETIKLMRKLGCGADNVVAIIGPCIQSMSYEVSEDFKTNFPRNADCFRENDGKLYFDLPKFCRDQLLGAGLNPTLIRDIGEDTYTMNDEYFSYRRAQQNTEGVCGRNISVICLLDE